MPIIYESDSIDAKRSPGPLLIGLMMLIAGVIITIYGVYSVVASLIGEMHAFGLIGGLLITPLGVLLMIIGGLLFLFGSFGVLFGRKNRRILY